MNVPFRLTKADLYNELSRWDQKLTRKVFLAACGGTALTLFDYKQNTKDVDFLIPVLDHYDHLIETIVGIGYVNVSVFGIRQIPGSSISLEDKPFSKRNYWILFKSQEITEW